MSHMGVQLMADRAIANRSLWIVEGVERVVFNVGKQLPFSPGKSICITRSHLIGRLLQ